MFNNRTRKPLARAAVVVAATGFAALTLAAPASAGPMQRYALDVSNCNSQSQLCPVVQYVGINTNGESIRAEFFADKSRSAGGQGCTDVIAHMIVDGREWGKNTARLGGSDGGYEIPLSPGYHTIGVQIEGIPGNGCNTQGFISGWRGTLEIEKFT